MTLPTLCGSAGSLVQRAVRFMSGARLQCVLGPVATAGHTGAIVAVPAVRAVAGATAVGTVTDAGLRGLRPAVQLALVSAARSVGRGAMRVTLRMDWAVSRAMVWLLMVGGLASLLASPVQLRGQEIPLEHCDALPVIVVTVAGQPTIFLVDTAATSMLNLKSFTEGRARDIRVTSWRGTLATSAKEVTLGELVVGSTKLVGLRLPAIDLSAIGDACGRKIDGILGVDLIAKLGITIDLKKEMLHVRTVDEEHAAELTAEMQRGMQRCLEAFNESDEREFGECLDTKIVLFTVNTELYGREQVMGYFRDKYFHQKPAAKLKINEMAFHPVGEAVWYEYEFTIESALGLLRGKGMAMCRKSEGRWRMASMHHSIEKLEPAVASR